MAIINVWFFRESTDQV